MSETQNYLNAIESHARDVCFTTKQQTEYNGIPAGVQVTDSGAISHYAQLLRELAEANRFRIVKEFGRMVIGYWPENDPDKHE